MTDALDRLLAQPPDLPVREGLDRVRAAVSAHGAAVVTAPPGSGKTTLVPPALAAALASDGTRVVVTQPRRIAARAAARRLAWLLGEEVGDTVGYTVRGEQRRGPRCRVEVVTTGVLLRRLQRDPDLPDVAAVVLDEVHERHLDTDLTLALLVDVRRHLRPDLPVVAMSATVDATRVAALLGGDGDPAPVVDVPGALHPVDVRWAPPPPRVARLDERGVTPAYLDHVADTVRGALRSTDGDVLVFLPGAGEVGGVVRRLAGCGADVRPLHGRLPPAEQDAALNPGPRRRVVVSTAVAESSLTVPGVRVVVDAGLTRQPRTDHRRGLAGLVTVTTSRSSAHQRSGRAGREGPGAAYRCWTAAEHERLPAHPEPEVATADLTGFLLECACWGAPGGAGLALLDPPGAAASAAALTVLRELGAVDASGAVTATGRRVAATGVDPRLGRALLEGAARLGARRAAEVVALLSGDTRAPGADLVAALRAARRERPGPWVQEVRRLERVAAREVRDRPAASERLGDDLAAGLVVALAHPERLARLRTGRTSYLLTGGTGATLPPGSPLSGAPWLAVAEADRPPGRADATIRAAAPVDEALAIEAAPALLETQDEVAWRDGRVVATRTTRVGAVVLTTGDLPDPPREAVARAVRDALVREGLDLLPWSETARSLRRRMAFCHRALGSPWPDVSDDALLTDLDRWLGPALAAVRGRGDLRRVDTTSALRALLPWPAAARLDELAPERLQVPSGSWVRVDYDADQPVLAVRVQEVFGWRATPRLADGRVPLLLHLLSPAGRPAAVTADLESFWEQGYPQVRAELRGRYPKHPWPQDPLTAEPTSRTTRRPAR